MRYGAADQHRRRKAERNPDGAHENTKPLRVRGRRDRSEIQEQERTDRTNADRDSPHQTARPERNRMNTGESIGAGVAKENGKQSPVRREFDQKKALRQRDETRHKE